MCLLEIREIKCANTGIGNLAIIVVRDLHHLLTFKKKKIYEIPERSGDASSKTLHTLVWQTPS